MQGGIVIITDQQDRHGYFVRQLIDTSLPVVGIITGAKRRQTSLLIAPRFTETDRHVLGEVKRQRQDAQEHYFSGCAEFLASPAIAWREKVQPADGDINHPRFLKRIADAKPDIVAVMGATLIRRPLLDLPCVFVNLHTGLSPYYRGGRSNMWPIIEGDFGYFGVTIHRITPGIDDGDIFASDRILVDRSDTYATINARAIKYGCAQMIKVLERLLDEPRWSGTTQWQTGKLFFDRDYNVDVARRYLRSADTFMREHVRRQRNDTLFDVQLVDPQR